MSNWKKGAKVAGRGAFSFMTALADEMNANQHYEIRRGDIQRAIEIGTEDGLTAAQITTKIVDRAVLVRSN